MKSYLTRREGIQAMSAAVLGLAFSGCKEREETKVVVAAVAVIGVFVGKRLVQLPHPAAKITGVILDVGSSLLIKYLQAEGTRAEQEHKIPISTEESIEIQTGGKVVFQRKDKTTEERKLDKIDNGGLA